MGHSHAMKDRDATASICVGPDRVTLEPDRLVVRSPADMDGWEVHPYRRPLIHFDDRTWRIAGKSQEGDGTFRYELRPWVPALGDVPTREIRYDADYVERRESLSRQHRAHAIAGPAILLLSPLLGFLGSGTKRRLEAFGLNVRAATWHSIYLQCFVILCCGTLASISMMIVAQRQTPPWSSGHLLLLAAVVGLDVLFRVDRLIREDDYPPGFYQWLIPRRGRRRK
ncbi:MAG: hypothetical protein GY716_01310 [bacterium]|nr:hypothetical protein [bacterium]